MLQREAGYEGLTVPAMEACISLIALGSSAAVGQDSRLVMGVLILIGLAFAVLAAVHVGGKRARAAY